MGVVRSAGDLWLPAGPTDPSCSYWGLRVCQVLVREQKPCLQNRAYILMVGSSIKKNNNKQGNGRGWGGITLEKVVREDLSLRR